MRLSIGPGFYYDTLLGKPTPEPFVDDESLLTGRLWGQGALLQAKRLVIASRPRDAANTTVSIASDS